ncbi:MAG: tRNA pseudouridine(54/55) synthase Pus10 [Candidatus Bathyarchaeia archaeon]
METKKKKVGKGKRGTSPPSYMEKPASLLEILEELLKTYPICDSCLGRQLAILSHGTTNDGRGRAAKLFLAMEAHRRILEGDRNRGLALLRALATKGSSQEAAETLRSLGYRIKKSRKPEPCHLCGGILDGLDGLKALILDALGSYAFNTFVVGVKVPREVIEREDDLRSRLKIRFGESIRSELARRMGKLIAEALGKKVDHKNPDLMILVNPFSKEIEVNSNPLYVKGRYRKLKEGIPQTSRPCPLCGGMGCQKCLGTGKHRPDSIEALIARELLKATGGEGESFHAAAAEGTYALATGKGVPFIVEIRKPKNRFPDLSCIERFVNLAGKDMIEILGLSFASRNDAKLMKQSWRVKEFYEILVEAEEEIDIGRLQEAVEALKKAQIRVEGSGGKEKPRTFSLYDARARSLDPRTFEFHLLCQGGLNVRAFVTGEEERMEPTFSKILGRRLKCLRIDLLDVQVD